MGLRRISFLISLFQCISWATTWENLFLPYSNNKGADQPAHSRSLISAFVVSFLNSIIPLLAIDEISRPKLLSSAEQAGLSLNWSQTPKTGFLPTWLSYYTCNNTVMALECLQVKLHRWFIRASGILSHISLAFHFWDLGKQCRPRSDAAERSIWSGSTVCLLTEMSIKNEIKMKKYTRHP